MTTDPTREVLQERLSRETGTMVEVVRRVAPAAGEQGERTIYETVCRGTDEAPHNGVCEHDTRALAKRFAPVPNEWCEECMAAQKAREGQGGEGQAGAQVGSSASDAAEGTEQAVPNIQVSYKYFGRNARGQEIGSVFVLDNAAFDAAHEGEGEVSPSGAVVYHVPVAGPDESESTPGLRDLGYMTRPQAEAVAREHGVELSEH
jgi:hypothetical protein